MHIPELLQSRFAEALASLTSEPNKYAEMIRGTNDPKFGDYQANCAMPLAKEIDGKNPREIAADLVAQLNVEDFCETPDVAGPGFINLKLKDEFLTQQMVAMLSDERCLVSKAETAKNIVIDFSSPNVAKPMHVGHIRSTVIGDCLSKVLGFLGHEITTDNHLGDWGTQFGIIIYGYKNFGDPDVVAKNPVPELAKLYRKVQALIEYRKAKKAEPKLRDEILKLADELSESVKACNAEVEDKKAKKKLAQNQKKKFESLSKTVLGHDEARQKVSSIENDSSLASEAKQHASVDKDVLTETAKLHEGDKENMDLWTEFLPHCKDEINRIYSRLNVEFDHTLGESFYHTMLHEVVDDLKARGLATESDGAICVFLPNFDAPMIVQKQDGAFLYSTTDIATLKYRLSEFAPDEILYVVDSRQGEHFQKLFDVAKLIDMQDIKLQHVNFGTVLGEDGKPMKTRSGTLIGLEGLLNDAVAGARDVVCDPERLAQMDPPMDEAEQDEVAETIGIAAIKYADLAHHRTSDYRFHLKKMVALEGNTATYIQFAYARAQNILKKVGVTEAEVIERVGKHGIQFTQPAERVVALELLKLEEALAAVYKDYAPNHLVEYVYSTAKSCTRFIENCHVLRAPSEEIQTTRLALVVLSGRVLRLALSLLGIDVVHRM